MGELTSVEKIWLIIGFGGQLLFGLRLAVQWWRTEQAKRSVIPVEFWYFSIGGAFLLLAYAIHRRDPVFILGQMFGVIVYVRNLYFVYYRRKQAKIDLE